MLSIPVDVLRLILEHVDTADLVKICLLNKICCSCSQDVLYRNFESWDYWSPKNAKLYWTLAQSTHLARRVRSFETSCGDLRLGKALQNMSSLRSLNIVGDDSSILDGCTFKLDSFSCRLPYDEALLKFLNSQPTLTQVALLSRCTC